VENISPKLVVVMYIDGLKESVRGYVKSLKPTTLEEAFQQAKVYSHVVRSR